MGYWEARAKVSTIPAKYSESRWRLAESCRWPSLDSVRSTRRQLIPYFIYCSPEASSLHAYPPFLTHSQFFHDGALSGDQTDCCHACCHICIGSECHKQLLPNHYFGDILYNNIQLLRSQHLPAAHRLLQRAAGLALEPSRTDRDRGYHHHRLADPGAVLVPQAWLGSSSSPRLHPRGRRRCPSGRLPLGRRVCRVAGRGRCRRRGQGPVRLGSAPPPMGQCYCGQHHR